jgi:Domain of unknown function (DUF4430)
VSVRLSVLALALALAAGIAGCGLGAGSGGGEARVLVTRDFGATRLGARIEQSVPGSETAMRMLQREFKVSTRYGGGFVQSIDGLAGGRDAGRPVDWFFYVNGVESGKGAAEVGVGGGDSIWWDRHDWSATQNVPAVVGSYPEPFLHGAEGKRWPIVLECADDAAAACTRVADRLAGDGARAVGRQALATGVGQDTLRVIVGPWREIGGDAALEQFAQGPAVSGVYAKFAPGGATLDLLDPAGRVARTLGAGAGLVAATRFAQQAPTWAITGTDAAGVTAAAAALGVQRLADHFALAVGPGGDRPLPVQR